MATDAKAIAQLDRLNRLVVYAAGLRQRLAGSIEPEKKNVLQIDLKKTEAVIAKLKG
jgi:hypothetical protein